MGGDGVNRGSGIRGGGNDDDDDAGAEFEGARVAAVAAAGGGMLSALAAFRFCSSVRATLSFLRCCFAKVDKLRRASRT